MNYLGTLFGDEAYAAYLSEDPVPNVAIVGGRTSSRQVIADGVRTACTGATKFRIQTFASVDQIYLKKAPRSSYEGHKAVSVLKRNWCQKHIQRVFGCVIFLIDWDNVKIVDRLAFEQYVLNQFDQVRQHLRSSTNTRVLLGLTTTNLSSSDTPPCGGYQTSEEAQIALRNRLGLEAKALVVLYRDGVDEYSIGRLQRISFEHCVKYHRDEIAKIKRMKGDAHRSTNAPYLQSRLRFKAGWHCLVVQDHKLMKHNLEKGYAVLRQACVAANGATLDERLAATLMVWMLIASNCNQLAVATSSKQELVLEMLKQTVFTFLQHLTWTSQPYTNAYISSLDADGVHLLNIMHRMYLGEWYELLGKKIARVLDAHSILIKRDQLTICPGMHFLTSATHWEAIRGSLQKLRSAGKHQQLQQAKEDRIVAPPPTFLGLECRTSTVYYRWVTTTVSSAAASTVAFDLLQQSLRYIVVAGVPRMNLQILYSIAEHFYAVEDYSGCYEKMMHIMQSTSHETRQSTPLHDAMRSTLDKLMVQACRKVLKAHQSSTTPAPVAESQEVATAPVEFDAYIEQLKLHLVRSMLSLASNRVLDRSAQEVVIGELSKNIGDGLLTFATPFALPPHDEKAFLRLTAFFSTPFIEASKPSHTQFLHLSLHSDSWVPLVIANLSLELGTVGHSDKGQSFVCQRMRASERWFNRQLKGKSWSVSASKPVRLRLPLFFPRDGLFEIRRWKAVWTVECGASKAVRMPLCSVLDNSQWYPKFQSHIYDASHVEPGDVKARYAEPMGRQRPVLRVVKPISPLVLESQQQPHAIEGELYTVQLVIRNAGAVNVGAGAVLLISCLPGTVDVVDGSFLEPAISPLNLRAVIDEDHAQRYTPDGYGMCISTLPVQIDAGSCVRAQVRFQCHKGGKFELPIRVNPGVSESSVPSSSPCGVYHLLTLHVCHPVFVTYNVMPMLEGSCGGTKVATPSDTRSVQFMESSVLRDANSVLDDDLADCKTLGRLERRDSDFCLHRESSSGGSTTLSNMLYTVERMQVPSDTRRTLCDPIMPCNTPLLMLIKMSNSLQCPLIITGLSFTLPEDGMLVSDGGLESVLPCTLGVDEDITVPIIGRYSHVKGETPLGSMCIRLQRGDNNKNNNDTLSFEIPLPAVALSNNMSCDVDYPTTVVAGESFFVTLTCVNRKSIAVTMCVQMMPPKPGDPIAVAGRTRWTVTLQPLEEKKTSFKMIPIAAGRTALPSLSVVLIGEHGSVLLHRDEVRPVYVVPGTQLTVADA